VSNTFCAGHGCPEWRVCFWYGSGVAQTQFAFGLNALFRVASCKPNFSWVVLDAWLGGPKLLGDCGSSGQIRGIFFVPPWQGILLCLFGSRCHSHPENGTSTLREVDLVTSLWEVDGAHMCVSLTHKGRVRKDSRLSLTYHLLDRRGKLGAPPTASPGSS